jgi:tetratricopeptide (TPR) repeat protein
LRPDRLRFACSLLGCLLAASGGAAASESDLPGRLEQAVSAAENSLRQGDLRAAENHYREALFDGWLLVGALERIEKRFPEARTAVRRASLFASDGREASRSLGLAHLQTGEPDEAVTVLAGLATREPQDVETRRQLAVALAAAGRHEQAVATLDEVSAKASEDPELAFLLGSQYLWLRNVDAAERLFAKAFAARPIPQSRVLIGRTYRDAFEYARARRELQAALRLDPKVRRAHYYLGMIILAEDMSADRIERAEAEFRQELTLAPGDPLASDQLGQLLLDSGRAAEALPVLETAVRGDARSLYLSHLGRCQLALERPAEAVVSLRRALELAEQQGASEEERERIHYQLGSAARLMGAGPEATAHLAEARRLFAVRNQAASSGTTSPESAFTAPLLEASALTGLTPPQRLELRRHVDASLARVYFNLGVIQAQDGAVPPAERFARAAESFQKAAEIDPAFPQVQASLGIAHFNARQFDKATEPLARALAASPGDGSLKRMLATAWLDTQVWAKAAALLNDDPELANDPTLQFARGLALLRSDRAAEAEKVLAALLAAQGDSAELLALLGEARAELSRNPEAERALETSRRLEKNRGGDTP